MEDGSHASSSGSRRCTSSRVIAWMAGMLYLPRLFVYHCRGAGRLDPVRDLQGHGAPAAQGHHQPGDDRDLGRWGSASPGTSAASRARLAARQARCSCWHALAASTACSSPHVRNFAADKNEQSRQRFYRIINEVPAVLMIVHRHPGDREAVLTARLSFRLSPVAIPLSRLRRISSVLP